jgi:glutathione peroxidase
MSKFYDFKIKGLREGIIDFNQFKDKKVLLVNTASECGFTTQYKQLEELQELMGSDKFCILGLPCNDFGAQEPGTEKDIADFCEVNYGVTFLMTEKIHIKPPKTHPLYTWLTDATENGINDFEVSWNFHKFLIDEQGNVVRDFPSATLPIDEEIIEIIKH